MHWQSVLDFIHCKLRTTLYDKFDGKRNEYELMSLIVSNSDVESMLKMWLEKQNELKTSKCSKRAELLKKEGNEFFKKKEYLDSIRLYTNSARYAPIDNGVYAITMANRSAALFYMGEYKRCLEDIDVAFSFGYPKELYPKLHLRAAQCWIKLFDASQANDQIIKAQNLIKNDANISDYDKGNIQKQVGKLIEEIKRVSKENKNSSVDMVQWSPEDLLSANPTYQSASSSLMRDFSPTRGRYVKASRPIRRGDTLFVEKPFAFVELDHIASNVTCVHCFGYMVHAPYPCKNCSHVSYCSKKCLIDSWSSYHKWECIGYDMALWKQIGIAHLAMRVFLVSIMTDDITKFHNVQELVTNIDKLSMDDLITYSITARMLVNYLEIYTNIFSVIDIKKCLIDKLRDDILIISCDVSCHEGKKLFVGSLLLRNILQQIANGHAISRLNTSVAESGDVFEEQQQRVAVGIYPSVSMMNHSCDPNTMNSFWNDYRIVKAVVDIPAGGEVSNCYGPHFRSMRLEDRHNILKNQYCFTCQCGACTDPELQNFVDRFRALKCSYCNGPVTKANSNSYECLNCKAICNAAIKSRESDLKNADVLFESAQMNMRSGNSDEAILLLKRTLEIRQKWLYKYNDDITTIYDSLGRILGIQKRFYDSISYLKQSLRAVEEKFGTDNMEIIGEINKITDISIEYLMNTKNRESLEYREINKTTHIFLQRAKKIMDVIGPWSEIHQEVCNKERILSRLL